MTIDTSQETGDPRAESATGSGFVDIYIDNFDRSKESLDTLTFKLALLVKAPVPRVKVLLRRLPARVKRNVRREPAERFKVKLAEIGVEVRLRPSEPVSKKEEATGDAAKAVAAERNESAKTSVPPREVPVDSRRDCPKCGWERDDLSEYCPLCLFEFPDKITKEGAKVNPESTTTTGEETGTTTRQGEIPGWLSWTIIGSSVIVLLYVLINFSG